MWVWIFICHEVVLLSLTWTFLVGCQYWLLMELHYLHFFSSSSLSGSTGGKTNSDTTFLAGNECVNALIIIWVYNGQIFDTYIAKKACKEADCHNWHKIIWQARSGVLPLSQMIVMVLWVVFIMIKCWTFDCHSKWQKNINHFQVPYCF